MPLFGPCSGPILSQRGVEAAIRESLRRAPGCAEPRLHGRLDDEFGETVDCAADLDRAGMWLGDVVADRRTNPVPSTVGLVVNTGWK